MKVESLIIKQDLLNEDERDEMYQLHSRYFANTGQDKFTHDLSEKEWVILMRDQSRIVGFSTQQIIPLTIENVSTYFLFSGDTVVDRSHWHKSTLAGSFCHLMLRMLEAYSPNPCYWYLITKGFRTYRYLPVFFKSYFPSAGSQNSQTFKQLLDTISLHKFPETFDAEKGIIVADGKQDRLRPEMSHIPDSRLTNPHVAYFVRKNPGFSVGDELACLTRVAEENFKKTIWHVINNTDATWVE